MKKGTLIIWSVVFSMTILISCKKKDSSTSSSSSSSTTGSTTGTTTQTFEQVLIGSAGNDTTAWKSTTMCGYPPCNFASTPTENNFTFYPNHTYRVPSYGGPSGGYCTFIQYDTYTWQIVNDNGSSAKLVSTGTSGTGTITISSYNSGQFVFSSGCVYTKQ